MREMAVADHAGGESMHDIVKELNDRNPSDIRAIDDLVLRRFEDLCEAWARIAEAERARRKSLPRMAEYLSSRR
jgi:hypothetical protein